MTIDERVGDVMRRLQFAGVFFGTHGLKPMEASAVVRIIAGESRQDGIEEAAEIAGMVREELSQRPDKLQYGRTSLEVAAYIEAEIRALCNPAPDPVDSAHLK